MRAPFLTLLATLFAVSYAVPHASPPSTPLDDLSSTHQHHALVRRAGLAPHVNATAVDVSPNDSGAYPRLARLSDGTLLASYTSRSGSTRTLTVTQSTNGGNNYTPLGTIAQGTGDLDNTFLLQLANGDVVAAYRNHDLDANGNPTFYRLTTSISHDKGATWSFLSTIAQRAATATKNGLWEPFMRLSNADGSLQVYYASEKADLVDATHHRRGGHHDWPGWDAWLCHKLMCVFETTENRTSGTFQVKSVVSTDEGTNWGQRSLVHAPPADNANAGAPQIVEITDGNLVVSFMTDEDSTTHDWPNQFVTFKIVTGPPVATGDWGHETVVTTPQSAWPGLLANGDGSVWACVGHDPDGAVCHNVTFTAS